jgi:hypothetical protein
MICAATITRMTIAHRDLDQRNGSFKVELTDSRVGRETGRMGGLVI